MTRAAGDREAHRAAVARRRRILSRRPRGRDVAKAAPSASQTAGLLMAHLRSSHQPRARSAAAQPRVHLQPGAAPGRHLGRHRQPRAVQGAEGGGRRVPPRWRASSNVGYRLDREKDSFRVAAIPRDIERAFSKRRQAIEAAARAHGYRSAKGMELAALRTRRAKREAGLDGSFKTWQAEAKTLGFELGRNRRHMRPVTSASERSYVAPMAAPAQCAPPSPRRPAAPTATVQQRRAARKPARTGLAVPGSAVRHGGHQGQAPPIGS